MGERGKCYNSKVILLLKNVEIMMFNFYRYDMLKCAVSIHKDKQFLITYITRYRL